MSRSSKDASRTGETFEQFLARRAHASIASGWVTEVWIRAINVEELSYMHATKGSGWVAQEVEKNNCVLCLN